MTRFTLLVLGALLLPFWVTGALADDMQDMADWCTKAERPSSRVICSDLELRRLAVLRNKIFADARANLPPDEMTDLNREQNEWVHEYTAGCGVAVDGPPVAVPVPPYVLDCYRRKGQERVTELLGILREFVPNYTAPSVSGVQITPEQLQAQREKERQAQASRDELQASIERERRAREETERLRKQHQEEDEAAAAAEAQRKLQEDAANEAKAKLIEKMNSLGFQLVSSIDLDLDWRSYAAKSTKVAVRGIYAVRDDVEGLFVAGNKDLDTIRLYTDEASRDARKTLLECRNSDTQGKCRMMIGATVKPCTRHKGQINEKEVPCLSVIEAYVLPQGIPLADNQSGG